MDAHALTKQAATSSERNVGLTASPEGSPTPSDGQDGRGNNKKSPNKDRVTQNEGSAPNKVQKIAKNNSPIALRDSPSVRKARVSVRARCNAPTVSFHACTRCFFFAEQHNDGGILRMLLQSDFFTSCTFGRVR